MGFRIVDTNVRNEKGQGMKFEKGKTLVRFTIYKKNKDTEYWKNKLKQNKPNLWQIWTDYLDADDALFSTNKRKAYPINRFQSYLVFEE